MFLDVLMRRNPAFLKAVVALHREGRLPVNCYVLDADTMRENARVLAAAAARDKMKIFGMTKQIGRCPSAVKAVVEGGEDRQASVRCGLDALPADAEAVLIHDGARALVTEAVILRSLDGLRIHRSGVAAVPVTDTVKRASQRSTSLA